MFAHTAYRSTKKYILIHPMLFFMLLFMLFMLFLIIGCSKTASIPSWVPLLEGGNVISVEKTLNEAQGNNYFITLSTKKSLEEVYSSYNQKFTEHWKRLGWDYQPVKGTMALSAETNEQTSKIRKVQVFADFTLQSCVKKQQCYVNILATEETKNE